MYIGVKGGCYRTYLKDYNRSMKRSKKKLEECFERTLEQLSEEELNELEERFNGNQINTIN